MGRRKVEIKKIESKSSRQVTFSKRRNGLVEKARQLSVLCDVDVAVVVISSPGKLYDFSFGDGLAQILDRYWNQQIGGLRDTDDQSGNPSSLLYKELLEMVESQLEDPNVADVTTSELIELEQQLESALSLTRAKKTKLMMEFVKALQQKEKQLREEKKLLASQIGEAVMADAGASGKEKMPENDSGNDQSANIRQLETLPLLI